MTSSNYVVIFLFYTRNVLLGNVAEHRNQMFCKRLLNVHAFMYITCNIEDEVKNASSSRSIQITPGNIEKSSLKSKFTMIFSILCFKINHFTVTRNWGIVNFQFLAAYLLLGWPLKKFLLATLDTMSSEVRFISGRQNKTFIKNRNVL